MKSIKILLSALIIVILTSVCVFAGDIPESLLFEDGAKVFIGILENFTLDTAADIESIEVTPTQKIKGDVVIGTKETYTRCDSILQLENGKEYLFCYIDENNFYIYDIKSKDQGSVVLVDSDKHDMTKRLEDYLNEGAFEIAEQERLSVGKQISFAEFLQKDSTTENSEIEKVTLRYQNEVHQADKDEFLRISNEIMITGAKDDMLFEAKEDSTPAPYETVLYIELLDENDRVINFAAVSRYGEVDRYALFMSRLMIKDYEMQPEDLSKLYSLFPEDIKIKLKAPENLPIYTHTLPIKPSGQPITVEIPAETEKNDTLVVTTGIAAVIIVAFTVFAIFRKKKRK